MDRSRKQYKFLTKKQAVAMHDNYQGISFYSLRMVRWYKGNAYLTRNGFNLTNE